MWRGMGGRSTLCGRTSSRAAPRRTRPPGPTRCQLANTHLQRTDDGSVAFAERGDLAGCFNQCR